MLRTFSDIKSGITDDRVVRSITLAQGITDDRVVMSITLAQGAGAWLKGAGGLVLLMTALLGLSH